MKRNDTDGAAEAETDRGIRLDLHCAADTLQVVSAITTEEAESIVIGRLTGIGACINTRTGNVRLPKIERC